MHATTQYVLCIPDTIGTNFVLHTGVGTIIHAVSIPSTQYVS